MNDGQNIFGFANPEALFCSVRTYHESFSSLSIRVHQDTFEPPLYWLGFTGVAYFSGMMFWKGADFRIGTQNELTSFLQELGYSLLQIRKTMIPLKHKLYIVDAIRPQAEEQTPFQVRIYAYDYGIEQVAPEA